jgi:hypothetical protein
MDGTIEIDQASGMVRVRGIVDAGMLRELLASKAPHHQKYLAAPP